METNVSNTMEPQHDAKLPVSNNIIFISYTIYIVLYEALVIGGCGYVVFGLHYSGWWWVLAVLFSNEAYSPSKWNRLLTGKEDAT